MFVKTGGFVLFAQVLSFKPLIGIATGTEINEEIEMVGLCCWNDSWMLFLGSRLYSRFALKKLDDIRQTHRI